MNQPFANRREAGKFLAPRLEPWRGDDLLVLALPRGGVPVAYEIAQALDAPLDVLIVRKLGVPAHEELAMGAIASGGERVLNEGVIQGLGIAPDTVAAVTEVEQEELERRESQYRNGREPVHVANHTVILVDDGLATGATMRAAVRALRQQGARKIIVAVPVGAPETCAEFETEADEVICGITPADFRAVGQWYQDFSPTDDAEVCHLLERSRHD